MKNKIFNDMITTLDKNLPTILTGISVVTGLVTTGYAVWTGYQTAKEMDDITEDAKLLDKVKKIGPKFIPVVIGAGASAGCAIAANHENGKRYAALAATLAATRLDAKKVQAKAEEILGIEKSAEVKKQIMDDDDSQAKKAFANLMSDADKRMVFRDLETGYIFRSTLRDFLFTQKRFNDTIDNSGEGCIRDFYEWLLREDYIEASTHNDVVFGGKAEEKYFSPNIDVELGPDMQPVYVISYKYATSLLPMIEY